MTSIIIVSYNTADYTKACVDSVRRYTRDVPYELIVVDNGSSDGSAEWLVGQEDVLCVLNHQNLGFPKGCNQGMALASGDELLLLNSDTLVTERWLPNLLAVLYSHESIGAVGPVSNNCSNFQQIEVSYQTIEEMQAFASNYNVSNPDKWHSWLWLVGFCLLMRRPVYKQLGGLDENFTPGNYEDDDYALRMRQAGWDLLLCEDTFIHHFGGQSFTKHDDPLQQEEKQKRFHELLARNADYLCDKYGMPHMDYKFMHGIPEEMAESLPQGASVFLLDCRLGFLLPVRPGRFQYIRLR